MTSLSPGPPSESTQWLTISVSALYPALFAVAPKIVYINGSNVADLAFTLNSNAVGSTLLTVRVTDSGGTLRGGVNYAETQVTFVFSNLNDRPSFDVLRTSFTVVTQSAVQLPFAQNISAHSLFAVGTASLSAQSVAFQVSEYSAALFTVPPTISSAGVLSFTVANNSGTTSLAVIAVSSSAVQSIKRSVSVAVIRPVYILLHLAQELSQFSRDVFCGKVAAIFGVSSDSIVVVSVFPGGVYVEFYVNGVAPSLTAATFIKYATDPTSDVHNSLGVLSASIVDTVTTTTTPPTKAGSGDSGTTRWGTVAIIVAIAAGAVLLVVIVGVAVCCVWKRRRKAVVAHGDEEAPQRDSVECVAKGVEACPQKLVWQRPQDGLFSVGLQPRASASPERSQWRVLPPARPSLEPLRLPPVIPSHATGNTARPTFEESDFETLTVGDEVPASPRPPPPESLVHSSWWERPSSVE